LRANRNVEPADGLTTLSSEKRSQKWLPMISLTGLICLFVFQTWFFYNKLPLSLGPRVILQPRLLKNGFVMYENIADLHSPLMPLTISALLPLLPDGLNLAQLVLFSLISLSMLLTFFVGYIKGGWMVGLFAAFFFSVWSPIFGYGKLWYETFLAPLFLLIFLFGETSTAARSPKSCFLIGMICGVAILFKQQAVVIFLLILIWNIFINRGLSNSTYPLKRQPALIGLGAILPVIGYIFFQYIQNGNLEAFFYWTIVYPLKSDFRSKAGQLPSFSEIGIIASSCLLLPGTIYCVVGSKRKKDDRWKPLVFGLALFSAASVSVYPRFNFFHLQAALPILAIVSAQTLICLFRFKRFGWFHRVGMIFALSGIWLISIVCFYPVVYENQSTQTIHEYSNLIPLAEAIKKYTGTSNGFYIFPDDEATANLYYLMGCSPPKFWVFHYPWYGLEWIRKKSLSALEAANTEWIVYFPGRWNAEKNWPEIMDYLQTHYRRESKFRWVHSDVWLYQRWP
jgi:hypothetical protein